MKLQVIPFVNCKFEQFFHRTLVRNRGRAVSRSTFKWSGQTGIEGQQRFSVLQGRWYCRTEMSVSSGGNYSLSDVIIKQPHPVDPSLNHSTFLPLLFQRLFACPWSVRGAGGTYHRGQIAGFSHTPLFLLNVFQRWIGCVEDWASSITGFNKSWRVLSMSSEAITTDCSPALNISVVWSLKQKRGGVDWPQWHLFS